MVQGLLAGFRALDLTDQKGLVCGKILATLGVDVIKVEKPDGDSARSIPPFYNDVHSVENSLYWLAYNTDKRGITLNLDKTLGRDIFKKLCKTSDFILESFEPGYLDELGLGYKELSALNPRIILTSITHFGQTGPYSKYKGSDLIDCAMSGVLDMIGYPDRPPVREGVDSIYFRGCATAAYGTMLAHYYREITGEGQHVDISLQQVDTSRLSVNFVVWEFEKRLLKRMAPKISLGAATPVGIWPCKDGYVFWVLIGGPMGAPANRALSEWISEEGIENPMKQINRWEEFDMARIKGGITILEKVIGDFFLRHTKKELTEQGLKRGINVTAVSDINEVYNSNQLAARDYWVNINHDELGMDVDYPAYFFKSNSTENRVRRRAPHLGEHNIEVYQHELGFSLKEIAELKAESII